MKLLNIGCGPVGIPVPSTYRDWEIVRLDVEAEFTPDLLMDAMGLDTLDAGQFDAAYASHLLEHIYPAEVGRFLGSVRHVLTDDGFFELRVPDALAACERAAEAGMLDAHCYDSPAGPVTSWDILYGYLAYQQRYGEPQAHHCGYSSASLVDTLHAGGFSLVYVAQRNFELRAVACKTHLDAEMMDRIGIVDG